MIGILSTALIVLINPQYQIQRANDGRRKSELKQIQAALEIFRSDVGGYPGDDGNNVENSGNSLVNPTDATIIYLQSVPKDPRSGADYFYCTQTSCGAPTDCASSICSSYALYACSEQGSKDSEANNTAPVPSTCSSGTGYYYKVLSP